MHSNLKSFPITDLSGCKQKVLNWLQSFSTFCFLDNQQYNMAPHQAECLVAAGVQEAIEGDDIQKADAFFSKRQWVFGHLSYTLRNSLHHLTSGKEDKIGFAPSAFFVPQVVLQISNETLLIHAENPEEIFSQIFGQAIVVTLPASGQLQIRPLLSKQEYIEKIRGLQAHILRGDCYEINFCQAFFAEDAVLNPFAVFQNLMTVSPNPFSAFYRMDDNYLLCASPERFLSKQGSKIISQPIKGTAQRDVADATKDERLKEGLRLSQKEQSENVMVVDLVRNDLTKICKPGTVKVDELFGIYSFPQVHQMISTISGELKDGILFSKIIEATFPMGSMTGAPKLSVMKLIDEYEMVERGLFSGSVGYKTPGGDFDFNVVIRSILYNAAKRYLSYQVGSGITFYSDAEGEWEECMLKAKAIKKVLSDNTP